MSLFVPVTEDDVCDAFAILHVELFGKLAVAELKVPPTAALQNRDVTV